MRLSQTTDSVNSTPHKKSIKTTDIETAVIQWSGSAPKKPLEWTGKFKTAWGKNNKFRFCGDPSRQFGTVYDHSKGTSETFYLEGHTFKENSYQKPETKDVKPLFDKLTKRAVNHPYFENKKITVEGLFIRYRLGNIVVPIYSTSGAMISWQEITPSGQKIFKKNHPLGHGYHFPIGDPASDRIYVCEGLATGATIHTHTNSRVYCAFSKSNLDQVTKDTLAKYPSKQVVLCLDNDGQNTHKTTVKHKNLITLCPEKEGDFNDHQKDELEKAKLSILKGGFYGFKRDKTQVHYISKQKFPGGKLIIVAAMPGVGKTTFITKSLTENWKNGDKRPYAYYGRENDINNLLIPRIEQYGGANGQTCFFMALPGKVSDPNLINLEEAYPILLKESPRGRFSALVIDHIGLLISDEIRNKEYEQKLMPILNVLHPKTALICTGHLTKNIKGRDLIHHIRGGTEFTGLAKLIYYLRKGKEENQRIAVKLKDSYTGSEYGGWLTEMRTPESDMKITEVFGERDQLLKEYGQEQLRHENKGEDTKTVEKQLIQNKIGTHKDGTWPVTEYLDFAKTSPSLQWEERTARRRLKEAGFETKKVGSVWCIFKKK